MPPEASKDIHHITEALQERRNRHVLPWRYQEKQKDTLCYDVVAVFVARGAGTSVMLLAPVTSYTVVSVWHMAHGGWCSYEHRGDATVGVPVNFV